MDFVYALSGFAVGAIVGLTGVGGGSLMTPLLVLLFGVAPATAVGTDLLYAAAHQSRRCRRARAPAPRSLGYRRPARRGQHPRRAAHDRVLTLARIDHAALGRIVTHSLGVASDPHRAARSSPSLGSSIGDGWPRAHGANAGSARSPSSSASRSAFSSRCRPSAPARWASRRSSSSIRGCRQSRSSAATSRMPCR